MTVKSSGVLFRVFEGSDCQLNYVYDTPRDTDYIVWGTQLPYAIRVHHKSAQQIITGLIRAEVQRRANGSET